MLRKKKFKREKLNLFMVNKCVKKNILTGSVKTIFLFEETVITSIPTSASKCISGKQSSSPRFSLARPPTPELLSSHHAADYCSS